MAAVTLLISVGGAPGPIIYSIRQNRPERIIFFVSTGSRRLVSDAVLPQLMQDPGRLPDHEFIVTPDEQDLGGSTFVLMNEVPAALRRLNVTDVQWPQLVDYTGGTKTMSAAMVWASSAYPCRISYIGAADAGGRTRHGVGTVVDGREVCILKENPWDRIAWMKARSAIELFDRGQYGNAASELELICQRVSEDLPRRLFSILAEVSEAFRCWDIFHHRNAVRLLGKNLTPLRDLAQVQQALIPGLKPFVESVQRLFKTLEGIKPGAVSWPLIHDLLANALRRAELEQKYEDATARCYSAIEKTIHYELQLKHSIDSADARPEQLPDEVRAEYLRRYESEYRDRNGNVRRRMQFGLSPAAEILRLFGDPIGLRFAERKEKISVHLEERNRSILGHGMQAMDYGRFRDIFEDALYLLKIEESALVRFPKFQ